MHFYRLDDQVLAKCASTAAMALPSPSSAWIWTERCLARSAICGSVTAWRMASARSVRGEFGPKDGLGADTQGVDPTSPKGLIRHVGDDDGGRPGPQGGGGGPRAAVMDHGVHAGEEPAVGHGVQAQEGVGQVRVPQAGPAGEQDGLYAAALHRIHDKL